VGFGDRGVDEHGMSLPPRLLARARTLSTGWRITCIDLVTTGEVSGIDDATFQEAAAAKAGCPCRWP
jgi:hypothetical protein